MCVFVLEGVIIICFFVKVDNMAVFVVIVVIVIGVAVVIAVIVVAVVSTRNVL